MLQIIIMAVCIVLVISFVSWLAEKVGGGTNLFIISVVLVVAYLAFSWTGVFAVIAIALLGLGVVALLEKAGDMLEEHDMKASERAKIKQEMQSESIKNSNDSALMHELEKRCMYLGYMDEKKWEETLPNFRNREYSTSFQEITSNFAKQVELQYVWQNKNWFDPYKQYILEHPDGSTVTKMLAEVDCPALKMTHGVEDGDLINTMLQRGTIRKSEDVPPLFHATFIKDLNEWLYTPTDYLQRLSGKKAGTKEKHTEEIDFDDL